MNKPEYIFSRISIVDLNKQNNVSELIANLKAYHSKYFHVFNLTNIRLGDAISQTNFKWRGSPFSISQSVKILLKMDVYIRSNCANTIVFCVNQKTSYLYAQVLIRQYAKICLQSSKFSFKKKGISQQKAFNKISAKLSLQQTYFSQQFSKMYRQVSIANPPVKILSTFQALKVNFIPLIEVYRETRYNQLELIYTHNIEEELSDYYLNLDKPLKTSIGANYYDKRPQTKFMKRPVVIYGDILIKCYSFRTLQKKLQFTLGFNTKNLIWEEQYDNQEGIISFKSQDLFENINQGICQPNIYIKIQNYCQNEECFKQSKCQECMQIIKKLPHRYNQVQTQLNKLHRDRSVQDIKNIFSLDISQC